MNWKNALACWTQAWQLNAIISNQFNWILSQLIYCTYKICTPDSVCLSVPQIRRFVVEWARWLLVSHCRGISEIFQSIVRLVLGILNWFDGFFYWFLISQFESRNCRAYHVAPPFRSWNSNFEFRKKKKKPHELCSQHTKYCILQLRFGFRSRYRYRYLKCKSNQTENWQTNESYSNR